MPDVVADGVGVIVAVLDGDVVTEVEVDVVGVDVGVVRWQSTNSPAAKSVIMVFNASATAGQPRWVEINCLYEMPVDAVLHASARVSAKPSRTLCSAMASSTAPALQASEAVGVCTNQTP